ncbi:hypothetical protein Lal_00001849 [Lupinus albus]|nr:hypothetical protein Lal_00001849 [Lupinus albus]
MSGVAQQLATMTRDNLYWLSHDQVALFKKFRGTASMCKQTINHAVPRIKQFSSLLYDFLLHCKNRSRIHPKIWLPVPIPKYPQYWLLVPILFQPADYQCQYSEFPNGTDQSPYHPIYGQKELATDSAP